MTLSHKSIQQLSQRIAALVVDDISDEVAELVHTTISEVMAREFSDMDEELEMDVAMEVVTNIIFGVAEDM